MGGNQAEPVFMAVRPFYKAVLGPREPEKLLVFGAFSTCHGALGGRLHAF